MNPFKRLIIQNIMTGGTLIRWEMETLFHEAGPYQYQVQTGRSPTEDAWENVGDVLIDAAGVVVTDEVQRLFGKDRNLWFRIELATAENVYYSYPEISGIILSKKDWLLYRKMCSNFNLLSSKKGGIPGQLFKRRNFGTPCPGRPDTRYESGFIPCLDWDTGEVLDSDCPNCFGVGRYGGYYPAFSSNLMVASKPHKVSIEEGRATVDDAAILQGRLPPFGNPSPYDFWSDCVTGKRYIIDSAIAGGLFRGVPVYYDVAMRQLPATDPIYKVGLAAGTYGYTGGYGTA
jgi:hypothetical protein